MKAVGLTLLFFAMPACTPDRPASTAQASAVGESSPNGAIGSPEAVQAATVALQSQGACFAADDAVTTEMNRLAEGGPVSHARSQAFAALVARAQTACRQFPTEIFRAAATPGITPQQRIDLQACATAFTNKRRTYDALRRGSLSSPAFDAARSPARLEGCGRFNDVDTPDG